MIAYFSKAKVGGWVSFTAHLATCREESTIISLHKRKAIQYTDFGYGLKEIRCPVVDLIGKDLFVTAVDPQSVEALRMLLKHRRLQVVIHDPSELKDPEGLISLLPLMDVIVIRQAVKDYIWDNFGISATLLPHPFFPYPQEIGTQKQGAACISRCDFDKYPHFIAQANDLLVASGKEPIYFYGRVDTRIIFAHGSKFIGMEKFMSYYRGAFKVNRLGKIVPDAKGHPHSWFSIANILKDKKFVVDFTYIKNDGGDTQYTHLEATHAGCALILSRRWLREGGVWKDGVNCFAVDGPEDLAALIIKDPPVDEIVKNARLILAAHYPESYPQGGHSQVPGVMA